MMDKKYQDMLYRKHPVSAKHPHMPMQDRAAQFSPFAALTGYENVISETGRLTEEKRLFEESQDTELEQKLRELYKKRKEHPYVECEYFQKDSRKEGGKYVQAAGKLKNMDIYEETILLDTSENICFSDISDIQFRILADSR